MSKRGTGMEKIQVKVMKFYKHKKFHIFLSSLKKLTVIYILLIFINPLEYMFLHFPQCIIVPII